ncbi:uncharacterized protein LOC133199937 [Saccostrea echinata]|uniref:uncharacterized protein LOC133199937 n=1 Tax=Saccostrea echinata TaxID=191078 RepID=UPI002A7EAC6C|nr:uncharacterized protein LOC133199937 [Saccostrea echinata]
MFALVLFDLDGCTAIIDAKKCQVPDIKALVKGQHVDVKYHKETFKVEILELSESRAVLNQYEDDWSSSHRSLALDKEKKKRRNKRNGYLAVWPHDQEDIIPSTSDINQNREEEPEEPSEKVNLPKEPERNNAKERKGSNGRKITILYEGSAENQSNNASPQRAPCYLQELSTDEAEVVELQMNYFKQNKICTSSQTEKVVVIQDEQEIVDLLSSNKKCHHKATQMDNDSRDMYQVREISTQTDNNMQTEAQDLTAVNLKLDEILSLLHGAIDNSMRVNNVSEIVRWVTANTSTPQPGMPTVSIVPVEESSILELPIREENKTSPVISTEAVMREEEYDHCDSSPPAKKALFEVNEDVETEEEQPRETGEQPSAPDREVRAPLMDVTHRVSNRKHVSEDKVLTLENKPLEPIIEIKDVSEVVPGEVQFRMRRDILADVQTSACSDGNFLWLLTRKLFHDHELRGKNFFGRKGRPPISPRRSKCLKHAYIECCGTSYKEFTKAVSSINNGIRSLSR